MNTFARCNKNKYLSLVSAVLLGLFLILGLQGCGSSSSSSPANPNGFYDSGVLTLTSNNLVVTDVDADISKNRFLFSSRNSDSTLIYDIRITEIMDNNYTGTVQVYLDGDLQSALGTVSGEFTQGLSISAAIIGTLTSFDSTFEVNYSLNNTASALTRIAKNWQGPINLADDTVDTIISSTGAISRANDEGFPSNTPALNGCVIDADMSSVTPVPNQSTYDVSVTLSSCTNTDADGVYTGLAATQTVADETLILNYTNGEFSGSSILPFNP